MAQHDMNIANQGFPATRADINNALQAIATNNSGTSAPSTTFANQWFYNESSNKLFIRNEANSAFIEVATLDQTNNEWQITTGQISAGDGDGLVFKTDDGNTRITLSDGGDVTFAAGTDVLTASAGTDNVRIGENAGAAIVSGGNNNTLIGHDCGKSITTGTVNTFVGNLAGDALTTAHHNTGVGHQALTTNVLGSNSVAVGSFALNTQNPASATDMHNTGVGYNAASAVTTGTLNTLIGALNGDAITTGGSNVGLGYFALTTDTQGSKSVAVGTAALGDQNHTSATDAFNVAVGQEAGRSCTTGTYNTFVGPQAGFNITTTSQNTVIGQFDGNNHNLDIRSTSKNIVVSNGAGEPRMFTNSDGYSKFMAKTGNYVGTGGAFHEFGTNNNDTQLMIFNVANSNFSNSMLNLNTHRTASTGFFFLDNLSGNFGDIESRMRGDGNCFADGAWNGGGADYAEYFEWADGNSDNQDRTGYSVVLDNEKIRIATSDDEAANIIGAVSVNPSIVGDADIDRWKQKYLRNDFGAYQKETYTVTEWTEMVVNQEAADEVLDDDGAVITPAREQKTSEVSHSYETDKIPDDVTVPDDATVLTQDANGMTLTRRILNPDYNPDTAYVSREDRQEWATIGMMGKLRIRKGQPTGDRWIKMRDVSDTVEEWLVR